MRLCSNWGSYIEGLEGADVLPVFALGDVVEVAFVLLDVLSHDVQLLPAVFDPFVPLGQLVRGLGYVALQPLKGVVDVALALFYL